MLDEKSRRERKEENEEVKKRRRKVRVRFSSIVAFLIEGTSLPHSGRE